jgi:hypothetical protein
MGLWPLFARCANISQPRYGLCLPMWRIVSNADGRKIVSVWAEHLVKSCPLLFEVRF